MAFKLGKDFKLYRQTTGTRLAWPVSGSAPNLDLIPNVRDLTVGLVTTEADVTTRGGGGYTQTIAALKQASLSFEMVYDTADADFAAIRAAFTANTVIALAVLDGLSSTAGTQGLWADFMVTAFNVSQPVAGAAMVAVEVKVGYSAVEPEWVTVGA